MLPRSNTLFHFTKNLDVLKSVLLNGFWPRYCLEDIAWQTLEKDFVAYPMVCFCDIPMSRITEHVKFYGSFGLGLTKEWGIKNNLNPVIYFSGSNPLHQSIRHLTELASTVEDQKKKKAGLKEIRNILAYSKPISGRMILRGEPVNKDFYQESEWRFVPQHEKINDFLHEASHNNETKLTNANKKTRDNCMLKFCPGDIRYIFVPTDSDIPEVMNFLQTELGDVPSAELKVLMSRVTSLQSVTLDA
ncbi:Putative abortive phage resistance protein AbiGi, antitoxin [Pseudomonas sp. LAMO17WK12:I6]|uniref:abortive infection system antitoxin AbiGi family protein n=1 Tax=unclassified Pseudomonas TaxID=196821 RepID=UPI000BD0C406|nr:MULTISPECIES: abortive infection system antitoxin AbiGi family protein [unclassified Pseudomonas]SNY42181.1 Putative abortive phage resistance protein AbiGi, antitoxin [Pseudomonas sp. LAMO17WK12:I6]SNY43823.1 Putative abortive phage resistance protein AbiGi, antitoxin [Pseudomonas sp. LAMO17WK12:I5]